MRKPKKRKYARCVSRAQVASKERLVAKTKKEFCGNTSKLRETLVQVLTTKFARETPRMAVANPNRYSKKVKNRDNPQPVT
jgi:hypothetical protein